ncbi:unnamed protein product [Cuscuta campestris]|uniref:Uncharacterized protein n=1 Tax=Cuscuta campestris TaxID=132261 RepID=A0A484NGG7_9ASTE|nr:unnamed protein product [Cuscuta campestris]
MDGATQSRCCIQRIDLAMVEDNHDDGKRETKTKRLCGCYGAPFLHCLMLHFVICQKKDCIAEKNQI